MKQPKKAPILKSFGYAFEGIFAGIKKERNMKIHCTMMVLVVAAGLFFQIVIRQVVPVLYFVRAGDGIGTCQYGC